MSIDKCMKALFEAIQVEESINELNSFELDIDMLIELSIVKRREIDHKISSVN